MINGNVADLVPACSSAAGAISRVPPPDAACRRGRISRPLTPAFSACDAKREGGDLGCLSAKPIGSYPGNATVTSGATAGPAASFGQRLASWLCALPWIGVSWRRRIANLAGLACGHDAWLAMASSRRGQSAVDVSRVLLASRFVAGTRRPLCRRWHRRATIGIEIICMVVEGRFYRQTDLIWHSLTALDADRADPWEGHLLDMPDDPAPAPPILLLGRWRASTDGGDRSGLTSFGDPFVADRPDSCDQPTGYRTRVARGLLRAFSFPYEGAVPHRRHDHRIRPDRDGCVEWGVSPSASSSSSSSTSDKELCGGQLRPSALSFSAPPARCRDVNVGPRVCGDDDEDISRREGTRGGAGGGQEQLRDGAMRAPNHLPSQLTPLPKTQSLVYPSSGLSPEGDRGDCSHKLATTEAPLRGWGDFVGA